MYSYREILDLQSRSSMTEDEKLEKKNLEAMRYALSSKYKTTGREPTEPVVQENKTDSDAS